MIKARAGIIFLAVLFITNTNCFCSQDQLEECLGFYNKIYQIMSEEYYKDVSKPEFEKFIAEVKSAFDQNKIWPQEELDNFKYNSTALLVNRLKDPQDYYSCFRTLEKAKDFSANLFQYDQGLGIEGQPIDKGFRVNWVEPRSDSFQQGLRENDIIIEINGRPLSKLTNDQVIYKLYPQLGTKVNLRIIPHQNNQEKLLVVTCREFFKKTAFLIKTEDPRIFCIKIKLFNEKIPDDLNEIFADLETKEVSGLILDFRDNIGGVTDVISDLAGYFIAPGKRLFYIQRKSQKPKEFFSKKSTPYYYSGPLLALMNSQTGSAAELVLGAFRSYGRIVLAGQGSSGTGKIKTFISSPDGVWNILLVIALCYLPDGSTFDNQGLKPDYEIADDAQALSSAADILIQYGQAPRN